MLVVRTSSPQWASGSAGIIGAPTNPADFAAFAAHSVQQVPGVAAWEIWNEADDNLFWENGPNAPAYAALSSTAASAGSPSPATARSTTS